jgi:hypothetical protein
MIIKEPTVIEISEIAKTALCRELGVSKALRFLQTYSKGQGDYTKERSAIYAGLTLDHLLGAIRTKN